MTEDIIDMPVSCAASSTAMHAAFAVQLARTLVAAVSIAVSLVLVCHFIRRRRSHPYNALFYRLYVVAAIANIPLFLLASSILTAANSPWCSSVVPLFTAPSILWTPFFAAGFWQNFLHYLVTLFCALNRLDVVRRPTSGPRFWHRHCGNFVVATLVLPVAFYAPLLPPTEAFLSGVFGYNSFMYHGFVPNYSTTLQAVPFTSLGIGGASLGASIVTYWHIKRISPSNKRTLNVAERQLLHISYVQVGAAVIISAISLAVFLMAYPLKLLDVIAPVSLSGLVFNDILSYLTTWTLVVTSSPLRKRVRLFFLRVISSTPEEPRRPAPAFLRLDAVALQRTAPPPRPASDRSRTNSL